MRLNRIITCGLLVCAVNGCATDDDCSLLGSCIDSKCVCNQGWTGVACSRADLQPLNISEGYQNASAASWGGRPIRAADGTWQLMATEITNHCPLILFEYNSQVVRAVSDAGPAGPYRHAEVVLPPFHHNPTFVGPTPDGYYLLFFIGANNVSGQVDCTHGIPDVPLPSSRPHRQNVDSNKYVTMAWAKDPVKGPWQQRVILRDEQPQYNQTSWHCSENNPTAVVLPNGTAVVMYRANGCVAGTTTAGEHLGIAVAQHWSGEYVRDANFVIAPETSPNGKVNNEDPFMWVQPLPDGTGQAWHIVNHQQSVGNVCGSPDAGHSCGAHWFARNPHGPWIMSPEPAYDENVTLVNGSAARFLTRQRPQLVFEDDGVTPAFLFTSGSFDGNNPDLSCFSHTYAHAFRH